MIEGRIEADASAWRAIDVAGAPRRSTDGQLVYAIGDVHGCYAPFRQLLRQVADDAAMQARGRTPILVLLGDYIDRGPASAQVLEAVAWLRGHAGFEVHALEGNHERVLRDFLDDPVAGAAWLDYGGCETLASYGVAMPADGQDRDALTATRDALLDVLPPEHRALLGSLDLMVEVGDYLFVHAGLRPHVALDRQVAEDLLWIRRGFLDHHGQHPRMVVHGHSWTGEHPQLHANRYGIDTGVYATDVLTALRLDGAEAAFLQAGPIGR